MRLRITSLYKNSKLDNQILEFDLTSIKFDYFIQHLPSIAFPYVIQMYCRCAYKYPVDLSNFYFITRRRMQQN